jgi:ArsR family transcriptional regulator, arsenate/arsenite/antimonite-responsive transcriptional repressor
MGKIPAMTTALQAIPLAEAVAGRIKGCCNAVAAPLDAGRATELAAVHRALADPMRVQMVHILNNATEPVCVCDFTAAFDLSQPTISHHLGKLRDAGIVVSTKRGIWSFHALNPAMSAMAAGAVRAIN